MEEGGSREEKRGEGGGAPSRLVKDGVSSILPTHDIIRRLPESGGGEGRIRRGRVGSLVARTAVAAVETVETVVAGAAAGVVIVKEKATDAEVITGAIDRGLCDFPACIFTPDSVLNDLSHWSH